MSDRQVAWVSVDTPIPYANNPRKHSREQVGQIAALIREYGWTQPIVVSPDMTVLAGHGRLMAAKRLKLSEVPILVVDDWNEAKAKAYVIADNKVALNSGWDLDMLKVEMEQLQADGEDLSLLGFAQDELDSILAYGEEEEEQGEDESGDLEDVFEIVIDCDSQEDQWEKLEQLKARGLKCRKVTRKPR